MASIRNRNGIWQARITRKGQEPVSKSFTTRHDAERWARQIETQIDQGRFVSLKQDERTTLGELIGRYKAEVTPQMKSAETDSIKLLALMRNPSIVGWHLYRDIRPSHFLGVHAQQFIPLLGLLAERLGGRFDTLGVIAGTAAYVFAWLFLTCAALTIFTGSWTLGS